MPSPIEKNALLVVMELFTAKLDTGVYPNGTDISKLTGLAPQEINDAVDYLDDQGLVKVIRTMGTRPYTFGGVLLNVHGKQFYHENDVKKSSSTTPRATKKKGGIKVFISHSNKDVEVAKKVIDLLRISLNLKAEEIRCTSVDGYRLQGGAETDNQLKTEVFDSEVLVGLVSTDSMQSHYTLFELGARWGARRPMVPLIIDSKGAQVLQGPLKGINALNAYEEAQLQQSVGDIGKALKKKPDGPNSYHSHIKALIAALPVDPIEHKPIENISKDQASIPILSPDDYSQADRLIKAHCALEWPENYSMQRHCIDEQRKAVQILKKGRPSDIDESQFIAVRKKAATDWPNNFDMRVHQEKEEFQALRELRDS
jgi:hypothetical protein